MDVFERKLCVHRSFLNVCMRERERNKEVYLIAGLSKERNIGQNKILKGKIEREKEKERKELSFFVLLFNE